MKTALLSKVALCVCPPAILATTVTMVPPVRNAVHSLTRPRHLPRHHAPARLTSLRPAAMSAPCAPAAPAPTTLLTLADLGPEDVSAIPASLDGLGGGGPGSDGLGGGPGYIASAVGAPPTFADQPISSVPEPATWLMLMAGLGTAGTVLRLKPRRRFRVKTDAAGILLIPAKQKIRFAAATIASAATGMGALWSELAVVRASSKPSTSTGHVAAASGKAAGSAALAKLAMCMCPPAAMIAGTAAIPTVRQAVYHSTAPTPVSTALLVGTATPPCDPTVLTVAPLPSVPPIPLATDPALTATGSNAATVPAPAAMVPVDRGDRRAHGEAKLHQYRAR